MNVILSDHAWEQATKRNLSEDDILFISTHGERVRRSGVIFCQLGKKHLPRHLRRDDTYTRLIGSTVLLDSQGKTVITVYRNEKAFRRDRKKQKYNLHNGKYFS